MVPSSLIAALGDMPLPRAPGCSSPSSSSSTPRKAEEVGPGFSQTPEAAPPVLAEVCRLGVLALNLVLAQWRLAPVLSRIDRLYLACCSICCAAVAAWAVAAPDSFRRRRIATAAVLRMHLPATFLVISPARMVAAVASADYLDVGQGGDNMHPERVTLLLIVGAAWGVLVMLQGSYYFPLPPILAAALQLAGCLLVEATNGGTCSSPDLQRPAVQEQMGGLYRLLEPAIAPLEPLLLATGVRRGHPARHCHCVLTALQFWMGFLLPTVVHASAEVRKYAAWHRRRQQLRREERQQQLEAWGFPLHEDDLFSSSDGENEQGHSSSHWDRLGPDPGSRARLSTRRRGGESGRQLVLQQPLPPMLAMALPPKLLSRIHRANTAGIRCRKRCRQAGPHPLDWQYTLAQRALDALRPSPAAAVATVAVLWHLYLWHRQAFL